MKVLFIGLGSVAKKHYDALKALRPDADIYALRSREESSEIAGVKNIFRWEEVSSDIDFAIISNPTFRHSDTLLELVKRKIPVFIEKPLSDKLSGLDELGMQIDKQKLLTYVACNLRFLPAIQYLKDEILPKCKKINEVNVYCGSYLPDWRPGKDFKENYSAREEMGGGVHLDLFHELDLNCWLFGLPFSSSGILRNRSSLNITAADFASYRFVYPDFVCSITLNYYRRDPKRTFEIVASDGTFVVDVIGNKITNGNGEIIFSNKDFGIKDTYLAQMSYFLGIFDGKNLSMNSFSGSLKILKICLNGEKIN